MFLIIDVLLIIIIIIIVFMIYSGFISLLDSNIMALTQNSIGPALFLFGLCTPIFDGINLILKFGLLILNIELLYLINIIIFSLFFNYILYFIMPLSNILLFNINNNHFILISFHTMLNVIDTFLVGCFIINTCFVYLATIRSILFSIISEFCIIIIFLYINALQFFALFNFIIINIYNNILYNILCLPIFIVLLIIVCIYLQNLLNIFEFAEAESELVAGTITEFSGVFFCISSLIELSHVILSTYFCVLYLYGGFFIQANVVGTIILIFLIPKLLLCSLNINNAILFLFFYIINYLCMYLIFINIINLFTIMLY